MLEKQETGDTLYQIHLLNLSFICRKTNHFYTNNYSVEHFSVNGLEKTLPKQILQKK